MGQLILYDFLRHIKRNLVIAFFMALVCLLTTGLFSLFSYEYGRYRPFAKLDTNNGYFSGSMWVANGDDDPIYGFQNKLSGMEGFERLYQVYRGSVTIENASYTSYVYESWIWENWQGRLQSGSWFDGYEKGSELIPVVLCGNLTGYQPGDILEARFAAGECQLLVQGILQKGTEILFSESYDAAEVDYDHTYTVPEEKQKFLIMQKEAADEHKIETFPAGIWALVGYREGLTKAETEEMNLHIGNMLSYAGTTHQKFLELSKRQLAGKLLAYIPFAASGLVLVLVSLFTVAFVNVEKGARYYSIYYLVGARRSSCFWIACGNVVGTVAVSAVFYALGRRLLIWYTRKENILYSTMPGANVLAAALYLLFALFLAVCMYFAMRKVSPLKLLKKHN